MGGQADCTMYETARKTELELGSVPVSQQILGIGAAAHCVHFCVHTRRPKYLPMPSFFHSFKTVLLKALNVALCRWWQTLRVTLVAARIDLHVNVRSTGGNVSKNLKQDLFLLVLLPLMARTRRPPHSRGMMRSCDSAGGVSCGA